MGMSKPAGAVSNISQLLENLCQLQRSEPELLQQGVSVTWNQPGFADYSSE